ncbi:MAG: MFS transporter [Pseudomonadota bacterium]|nr:MFS transporter [Pseudomonadota bacterium]
MKYRELFFNPRIMAIGIMGFASGLPLSLSDSTLQAWLTVENISIASIGMFSLVGFPYLFKFAWAPLLDWLNLGFLGRRKDWIFVFQLCVAASLLCMGQMDFAENQLYIVGAIAFLIALFSASQDIVVDAYRADVSKANERAFAAAISVTGYRIAMIVSGAGALIGAQTFGFSVVYSVLGCLMVFCALLNFVFPKVQSNDPSGGYGLKSLAAPFYDLIFRKEFLLIIFLVLSYKLGDAFAGRLTTTFLLRHLEFSLVDVGSINKALGLAASIIGAIYGGVIVYRFGLYRSLLYFGVLQALTNLGFFVLSLFEKNYFGLVAVIGLENLAGGMGTAAFIAFLMNICNKSYTATQFAILTAVASLGRVFSGPPSGFLVEAYGWSWFFIFSFLVAIPSIVVLRIYRVRLDGYFSKELK